MKLVKQTPKRSLNKAFLKQRPLRSEIDLFKSNLIRLLGKVDEIEREENQKNHVRDFLRDTFYKESNEINTKDSKDLVIHLGKTSKDKVGVIIEAKRPSNKSEMLSSEKPNTKALHELVLYYLRERIDGNNIDIKYLVATNIFEWYIIDASYFEKIFFRNKAFVKEYEQWKGKQKVTADTKLFYDDIVRPFVDKISDEIPCTYFDIRDYEKALRNIDKEDDKHLIALFKILSPYHLLKTPFSDDSNKLNENFYKELLHIIGLEEAKEDGKNVIRRKVDNRSPGSFLEKTIEELKVEGLRKVPDPKTFGEDTEEQYFNIALELCITWINRILFLKLLEGQLINYHKGDKQYRFLNNETINDFDELFKLFHKVLAVNMTERTPAIKDKYSRVPYLNSSLFEISDLEDTTIKINALDNSESLGLINTTILKEHKKNNGNLKTLDYLFQFLDAYDFASEGKEDIQDDNKTLINASVLGKIFEKINGYKEGSIFTPGYITMYMCRQAIRLAIVQKFNDVKKWSIKDFSELYNKIEDINEANRIINDVKICDPAVGSGHFLVSALNEIIAIKSELKILKDKNGNRLKEHNIEVINDELIVTDEDGDIFGYNPHNRESQRLQETLFEEKQTIIENCLFGVDINPNSVKICRLRLWIELLKNAYYKEQTKFLELETLPNIDINIKCGNSLISRFTIDADLSKALKSIKYTIEQYKGFVKDYKNEKNRDVKRELQKIIDSIKIDFKTYVGRDSKEQKQLDKFSEELFNKYHSEKLFSQKLSAAQQRDKAKLEQKVADQKKIIEDINNSIIYKNAFEWRFEFPEVLNNNGDFEGFDLVIANPPYIRQEELGSIKAYLKERYKVFVSSGDIFSYFYETSHTVLKEKGKLAFINNTFDKTTAGGALREFVSENFHFIKYIDFTSVVVFEGATTYPAILIAEKEKKKSTFKYYKFSKESFLNKSIINNEDIFSNASQTSLKNTVWNFFDDSEEKLITQINIHTPLIQTYGKCYYGIKTGFNEAFIVDKEIRDRILSESPDDGVLIKPFFEGKDLKKWFSPEIEKWLIFTKRGTEIEKYPAILKHLSKYKELLEPKPKGFNGDWKGRKAGTYKWFEIQDSVDYFKYFETPKITWANLQNANKFSLELTGRYINAPSVILPVHDKYLLAVLNSKVVWHFLKSICVVRAGGYMEIKPQYFDQIPIPSVSDIKKKVFEIMVDYLLFLSNPNYKPINDNVSNDHIGKFFEDIINGCVYELYFNEHVREKGINILDLCAKQIPDISLTEEIVKKGKIIAQAYGKLRESDNEIRNRILLFATRSPDIILPIIKGS